MLRHAQQIHGLNFFVLLLTLIALKAGAQNTYNGKYSLSEDLSGTAQFGYFLQRNDTIYNGPFQFKSSIRENEDGELVGVEYLGEYVDGKKSGRWNYRYQTIVPGEAAVLEGMELVQKISGEAHTVSGDFKNGQPHGNWQFTRHRIENSRATDTLFSVTSKFVEGTINGATHGYSHRTQFSSNFDESGRLHGSWKTIHTLEGNVELLEIREYEHGVFKAHYFELLGEQFSVHYAGIDQHPENDETWVDVPFREENINHLIFIIQDFEKPAEVSKPDELEIGRMRELISESNELLSQALNAFHTHRQDRIWHHNAENMLMNSGMMRIREFSLTPEQRKKLKESQNKVSDTERIITNFFEDPQIDIGKHSYHELNYFSAVFDVYFKNLRKLNNTLEIISDPSFKYVNLDAAFDVLKPSFDYPDSVIFQFKDEGHSETYTIPRVEGNPQPIAFLHAHISQVHREVIVIEEKVGKIVEKYKKQSQLTENEEKLVEKRDSIVDLFRGDLAPQRFNEYHQKLSEKIEIRVNEWFENYAELNLEVKLNRLEPLLECFDEVLLLYEQLAKIPLRLNDIDELYTRTVWNPYTYTDMDERIKERLYRAYEQIILPTIWEDLQSGIECGKITEKGNNYQRTYQKMVELREQDTKELEREIRRINSYSALAETLSLSLKLDSVQE